MRLKKVGKILSNVFTILLLLFSVFLIYELISAKISGGEPQVLGYQIKTVLSGSMEPKIHTGSVVIIKTSVNKNDFKRGDVITFRTGDNTNDVITHRIKEIHVGDSLTQYVTKGDANKSIDPDKVLALNVVGKYTGVTVPYLGYVIEYSKSKMGAILLMIVPGVLILLYQFISLIRRIRKLEKENRLVKENLQNH